MAFRILRHFIFDLTLHLAFFSANIFFQFGFEYVIFLNSNFLSHPIDQFRPIGIIAQPNSNENNNKNNKLNRITSLSTIKMRPVNANESFVNIKEVTEQFQLLTERINLFFGKQIVFSLLSGFICITVQLYYIMSHIKNGFTQKNAETQALASCSLLFLHGMEFWSIFTSGDLAKTQWKMLINKLHLNKLKSTDEDYKNKVNSNGPKCKYNLSKTFFSCRSPN